MREKIPRLEMCLVCAYFKHVSLSTVDSLFSFPSPLSPPLQEISNTTNRK